MIWLAVYLYLLLCIMNISIANQAFKPKRGFDLAWRVLLFPVLAPILLVAILVRNV